MQEAVHPRLANVAIGLEIPARVEGDVWFPAFLIPVEEEVLEGIDVGSRDVRIVIEIIELVEEAARFEKARFVDRS